MVLDERSRHHRYQQLESALGSDAAATLMEHLPPVGWADVATKRDLDQVRRDLDQGLALMRSELLRELGDQRAEFHRELRSMLATSITVNLTALVGIAGAGFAAFKLA